MAAKKETKKFIPKPRKKRPGTTSKPRGMGTGLTGRYRR